MLPILCDDVMRVIMKYKPLFLQQFFLHIAAKKFLLKNLDTVQLSARSYTRIMKVAGTIADLASNSLIELNHVAEALHYRRLDKLLIIPEKKVEHQVVKTYASSNNGFG